MQNHFTAYRITCLVSGKVYIGVTKRAVKDRWQDHKDDAKQGKRKRLCSAIRKYGAEQFVVEPIAEARTVDDLFELECLLIAQYDSYRNGYNMTVGGDGPAGLEFTEQMRRNMSEAHKGKVQTAETIAKRVEKLRGKKLPPRSQEYREKASAIRKGKPLRMTPEGRASKREKLLGRKFTAEWRAKISAAKKGKPDTRSPEGKAKRDAAMRGRKMPNRKSPPLTAEHRAAISAALRRRSRGDVSMVASLFSDDTAQASS